VRTKKEGKAISRLNQTDSKYASMVYAVDQNIGKLIKNLKENNLYDNTMIVFTSDNGGLSTQKKIAPTSVYPLRAGKGWLYEGGIKIPQLIKVPGISKNTKIYDLTVSHDLFPTILDFSGIKYNIEVDGISLKPIIENKDKTKREEIFWYYPHYHGSLWKPGSAIRYKNWKLVLHYETESSELFDLEDDPGELNDLSLEFPQIKNNLLNKIDKIIKETDAKLVSKNKNYIID
jgi:arylsulfatase A-like enzyme